MTDVGTAPPRTLAEALRERDDDSLRALLSARPDLARPAPVDMTQLASRAATTASVSRAVDSLDALHLQLLSTLAALGDAASLERLQAAVACAATTVARVVDDLAELALVWGPPSRLRVARAVHEVLAADRASLSGATLEAPALDGPRADPAGVDAAAAGAAFEAVRRVDMLLDTWAESPPGVLRSGGVGVREARALATMLDVDEAQAGFWIELAAAAGLVSRAYDGSDEVWAPTTAATGWPQRPLTARWHELCAAWLATPRATGMVGGRDERGRTINPLAPDMSHPYTSTLRRLTLRALERARPMRPSPEAVGAWVVWQRPRCTGLRDQVVRHTQVEAGWLGLAAAGVLSEAGAALVDGRDPTTALRPLLPRPVDTVVLQADLTAVAPGPLERDVARSMALLADVESRGGATVYRFTAGSLRRALDAGWPATRVHNFLAEHSSTPVPQPLTYLVDDAARRHGRIRVGGAETFIRSDDPAEIEAIVADHSLADIGLRQIAPTVALSDLPADDVVRRLRQTGHGPVPDGPTLTGAPSSASLLRRPPRPAVATAGLALGPNEAATIVSAVRAGDRAAARRPGEGVARRAATSLDMLAALHDAAQSATSVWLSYVDRAGTLSERIVDPLRVDAGWLTAHDHRSDRTRTFALHRIRQVAPLSAP